ncbi:sugar-binding domain-containing protein [Sinomonas sp. ASV486]|uniref:Sugar-binding transcriptional regulator n=1 Tax=Sinomonas puerhi TaxID=3238584 RepID=A0AB39KY80_9MICC|nr:sugar-binding domain-containing protein [Sinomonas sp. ASV486]MDQ4491452.1 sugar-binding domain-containing protein [Sinomonas sp. ASV486]
MRPSDPEPQHPELRQSSQNRNTRKHQDALSAARLYYLQDLTMDRIARQLRTSRSTVSRLLAFARDEGLVQIEIHSPIDSAVALEAGVAERFGIAAASVHVVPQVESLSETENLDRVAMYAARTLTGLVASQSIIGIAWGSTLSAMSRHVSRRPTHGSTVVQLNGAANTQTMGVGYASEIMRRFGRAFDADVEEFPVPAFFDRAETKKWMWKERSVRRVLDVQERMTLAVFGVGAADADLPSHVYAGGYLDAADLDSLAAEEVVGDVATVFFRADGSSDGIELNARATGPSFSTLRRVPRRLCIVSGPAKAAALRGALRAQLVTDLIVDEATARAVLAERA